MPAPATTRAARLIRRPDVRIGELPAGRFRLFIRLCNDSAHEYGSTARHDGPRRRFRYTRATPAEQRIRVATAHADTCSGSEGGDTRRRDPYPLRAMDAFSYLSVMISLILGLAITQVLKGFRGLMQARTRLQGYWPAAVWAILVVVIAAQSWWSMFDLRHHVDWTFLEFSAVLSQTIVIYLLAALALPDVFGDSSIDLREHYFGHRSWFFSLLTLLIVSSIVKQLVVEGALPRPLDLAFHVLFIATSLSGVAIRAPRYHEFLAAQGAVVICAYIALLFAHLR
jgi:hypothetical protein